MECKTAKVTGSESSKEQILLRTTAPENECSQANMLWGAKVLMFLGAN